jgi:hypothetical protein
MHIISSEVLPQINRRVLQFGAIATLFSFVSVSYAQQTRLEPIFSSEIDSIVNVQWLASGDSLIFQAASVQGTDSEGATQTQDKYDWYEYQIKSSEVTALATNSTLPAQLMPFSQQPALPPANDAAGESSFAFHSPDNRYAVYAAQKPTDWNYPDNPLAIADLRTGESMLIDTLFVLVNQDIDSSYIVQWSENSSAFIVFAERLGANPRIYYVTNYMKQLNALTATYLDKISVKQQTVYPIIPYDISSDGKRILLDVIGDNQENQLFIWNTDDSNQSQFITEAKINLPEAAAFSPIDEQKLIYLDKVGLAELDLNTGATTVLDASLNSTWIDRAWFSPDGKHIALYEKKGLQENNLYVVDVQTG